MLSYCAFVDENIITKEALSKPACVVKTTTFYIKPKIKSWRPRLFCFKERCYLINPFSNVRRFINLPFFWGGRIPLVDQTSKLEKTVSSSHKKKKQKGRIWSLPSISVSLQNTRTIPSLIIVNATNIEQTN